MQSLGWLMNSRSAESDRVLSIALAHMSHGLVLLDAEGRVILASPKALEFYGLSPDSVRPGTSLQSLTEWAAALGSNPARDAAKAWERLRVRLLAGEATTYRETLPSGRVLDVLVTSIPHGGCSIVSHDVTEQTFAEAGILEQHRRFDTALSNMAQGLLMLDSELRLIVCNSRYRELFSLSPDVARPGADLAVLIAEAGAQGAAATSGIEETMAERRALFARGERLSTQFVMVDGRSIEAVYNPMLGGGWVATYSDVTERKQAELRMGHMARHDALTDLPNRTLLRETLALFVADACAPEAETLAVLCLDLDRFKSVNDTLGHAIGDTLLRAVAGRLLAEADDKTALVARLGGDEFALLLPRARPEDASAIAKRLIETVGAFYEIDGHRINVGLSIGIAFAPADARNPDQLLRAADLALYRAKSNGRGTFCFFEPEMDARMQARRELELDLRHALAADQFELHYQPLVTLDTDQISGFEALIRWRHPRRGLISPAEFIPLAEEVGLIVPIGEWVLREACREAATWPSDVNVAVNLSPVQFRSPALVLTVVAALAAAHLDSHRLELEITEGVLLHEVETTLSILHQLKEIGVRISVDDFGTGYSSLNYLRAFPFDKIKIDRAFVADIASHPEAAAIVRAVTNLGLSLGVSTTAEGIETQAQLDYLRSEGCTEVQGYFISRPRPACDIPGILARGSEDWGRAAVRKTGMSG